MPLIQGSRMKLSQANKEHWLVKELGATETTDAPIQSYQRTTKRIWPKGYEDFNYNPSEAYLQLEANVLASMPYMPLDPDEADESDRKVFMDKRYLDVSPPENIEHFYRGWWKDQDLKKDEIVQHPYCQWAKDEDTTCLVKVKEDYKTSWAKRYAEHAHLSLYAIIKKKHIDWEPNTAVVKKQWIRAKDPTTGVVYYWVSKKNRVTGETFDEVENEFFRREQPEFTFVFKTSLKALDSGNYPKRWNLKTAVYHKKSKSQYRLILTWMRKNADLMNAVRWYLLTEDYVRAVYEAAKGAPLASVFEWSPAWAEGIGKHIHPKLAIMLTLRNCTKSITFEDTGIQGNWTNEMAGKFVPRISDYDVFGNFNIPDYTQDELAFDRYDVDRPSGLKMQQGYSFVKQFWDHGHPDTRKLDRDHLMTGGVTIHPKFLKLLEKVKSNDDIFPTDLESDEQTWLDSERSSNDFALLLHEVFGHGYLGQNHTSADAEGTDYQKALHHLTTVEEAKTDYEGGIQDVSYHMSNVGNYGPPGGYWHFYQIQILNWVLEDPGNRDFYGKLFSDRFGINIVYNKPTHDTN